MREQYIPKGWNLTETDYILKRVRKPIDVDPDRVYREIGIRSHGKGLFYKDRRTGASLGNKSVFWVEPDCFVFNIVFAWEQAVAKTTVQEKGMIASHRFPMYKPVEGKLDLDYILYFFKTPLGKHLLGLASPGGAGRNKTLGQQEFKKLTIPLPPYLEQRKIAAILSTWDEAIACTERLIAALQARKKGFMQRLLNGQVRFPGFKSQGWIEVHLGDIALKITDGTHKTPLYVENGIPFISTNNLIPFGLEFDFSQYQKYITIEEHQELVKRCKPETGDLLISKCGTIGRTQLIRKGLDFSIFVGLALVKLNTKKVFPEFLEQLLNTDVYQHRMEVAAPGGTRATLTIGELKKIFVILPKSIEEQQKIALLLQLFDKDIALHKSKLDLLKTQKKGLMQCLLTGELRVKV